MAQVAKVGSIGIRVFPNKKSPSVLADRSLIHYQGFAPIYGDRLKAGELPVPDFQGNRPADFFSNQIAEKDGDIHGHIFTHTSAVESPSVIHYARGESTFSAAPEKETEEDSGFFNSTQEAESPPPPVEAIPEVEEEPIIKQHVHVSQSQTLEVEVETHVQSNTTSSSALSAAPVREEIGTRYRTFGASGEVGAGGPTPATTESKPEPKSPPNTPVKDERSSSSSSTSTSTTSNQTDKAQNILIDEFAFLQEGKKLEHARRSSEQDLKDAAAKLEESTLQENHLTSETPQHRVHFRDSSSVIEDRQVSVDQISTTSSEIPAAPPLDEEALRGSGSSASLTNSSQHSSLQNSPPQAGYRKQENRGGPLNADLLTQLKKLDNGNALQSLASLKEEEKRLVQQKEREALEEIEKIRKEYTSERFMAEIPRVSEKSGKELPDWQRAMMAKKRAEQALQDEERRILADLDDWKCSRSPNWKRSTNSSGGLAAKS